MEQGSLSSLLSNKGVSSLESSSEETTRETSVREESMSHLLSNQSRSRSTSPHPPKPKLPSPEQLILGANIAGLVTNTVRSQMSSMMSGPSRAAEASRAKRTPLPRSTQGSQNSLLNDISTAVGLSGLVPANLANFLPTVQDICSQIRQELEASTSKLLALNPSRREAVAQHLERLANQVPNASNVPGSDSGSILRRWIEGPRSAQQNLALQIYFEEVALISVGQAILLKAWSDRGIRTWKEEDVGRLNWTLSSALRPHVPLDREGWQITRQNLYSWYNPSIAIQKIIWQSVESWRITEEGSSFLFSLLRLAKKTPTLHPELRGYDPRFFHSLWEVLAQLTPFHQHPHMDGGPSGLTNQFYQQRKKTAFSPTLRDGTLVRTAPNGLQWMGLESHPFQILLAELVQLWWGPGSPPLWTQGTGLEVASRNQLSLSLNQSPKPSLMNRISEMAAADYAWVTEERCVRYGHRSIEATALRDQLESQPHLKPFKNGGTSLGDIQACISITKLRPGGLMVWLRDEPLSQQDGTAVLSGLLDHAKLIAEWNFSQLDHGLPSHHLLFPKYVYLFSNEPELHERISHRPMQVTVIGNLRSHVEVPFLFQEALSAPLRSRMNALPPSGQSGSWQISVRTSPTVQKEWIDHWPSQAAQDEVLMLEDLKSRSQPLASVSTIRHTPPGDPLRDHAWTIHPSLAHGFWIQAVNQNGARKLVAHPLPKPGHEGQRGETKGSGFLIILSDEAWVAPLMSYLESKMVSTWLEHHTERKGDRWNLLEPVVKFIPIPQTLLQALGEKTSVLPGDWEKLAIDAAYYPRKVLDRLRDLAFDQNGRNIRAALFVRVARAYEHINQGQGKLLSLVCPDGSIRWAELLSILPRSEVTNLPLHPMIRLNGKMPNQIPISRIERVRIPSPGIQLATDSGFHVHIGSEAPRILDILWDQLHGLKHPTWGELTQYLKLPRKLEVAEQTAQDILISHGEQSTRIRELLELLNACLDF